MALRLQVQLRGPQRRPFNLERPLLPSHMPSGAWFLPGSLPSPLRCESRFPCSQRGVHAASPPDCAALGTAQLCCFFCIPVPPSLQLLPAVQAGRVNTYLLLGQRRTTCTFTPAVPTRRGSRAQVGMGDPHPPLQQGCLHQHLLWKQCAKITPSSQYSGISSVPPSNGRPAGKGRKTGTQKKKQKGGEAQPNHTLPCSRTGGMAPACKPRWRRAPAQHPLKDSHRLQQKQAAVLITNQKLLPPKPNYSGCPRP